MVAPGQDLGRGCSDLPRQHRDVRRRALRAHPGHLPASGRPIARPASSSHSPHPRPACARARADRSSARISLGRSRMRRRRSRGFGKPAISLTGEITAVSFIRESGRPPEPGRSSGRPLPSDPRWPMQRTEACRKRVLAGQNPKRDRDLPAPAHTQLRAQCVRMRLRRAGRDAEPLSDLVVRASRRDQRDYFGCLGVRPVPLGNVIVIMASEASLPRPR